jgi:flagellar motor switch protein FliM
MEVLEQDRIAALVEAAKEGQLPESEAPSTRRSGRVRTVDFSRPTKFGADHQRGLNRATDTFCQTANTRLSSELRWPLELEPLGTAQLTWTATQGQIAPNSLLAVLEIEPLGSRIVLAVEQSFVIVCLECMLGGTPERPSRGRRLTEIDWSLAHSLFDSLVTPLSMAWKELGGVTLKVIELDAHDAGQIASVSEPTFSTQIEVKINQQSYSLGLLVPWAAIEPIERKLSGHEEEEQQWAQSTPLQDPLGNVPVAVRAEVAHVQMAVRDILALGPGSTIHFEAPAADGIELYADSVPLARARAGRQGPRRAVQLSGFFEEGEPSRTNHAADLQAGWAGTDSSGRRSA